MTHFHDIEQERAAMAVVMERAEDALQTAHNALLIAKARSFRDHGPDQPGEQTQESYRTETLQPALDAVLKAIGEVA